jgi:hypothetical protein
LTLFDVSADTLLNEEKSLMNFPSYLGDGTF